MVPPADTDAPGAPSVPDRASLHRRPASMLHRGKSTKADLMVWPAVDGRVAIKDVACKPWWARAWCRWNLRREWRAYGALRGLPGLPRPIAMIDADAIAVERIRGTELIASPDRFRRAAEWVEQLQSIVDSLHRAGWVHLDLRGRHNVLVDETGRIVVVDLGSAFRLRPGGLLHRLLFSALRRVDGGAVLKWRRTLLIPADAEEWRRVRRSERWSSVWWLNPKRHRRI